MVYNVRTQLNPTEALIPLKIDKIKFLVVHETMSGLDYTWQQCNADHKANGWACAGYGEMIYPDGTVYILRGDHIQAQCEGHNSCSYGIALVGNFETNGNVPQAQYQALIERANYHLSRFPKSCVVIPHRDLAPTSCPGNAFPMLKLLKDISATTDSLMSALNTLVREDVVKSPDYWLANAKEKSLCKGEYVAKMIENMAIRLNLKG